jgi:hypothetical protein
MIDVSELANDPDLAQVFTILRTTGSSWLNGVFQTVETTVQSYGPISVATPRDVEMIPEGDKIVGAMVFWSAQPLYGTEAIQGVGRSSDILQWKGLNWRVLHVSQYLDYGFYRAVAVRMKSS